MIGSSQSSETEDECTSGLTVPLAQDNGVVLGRLSVLWAF